MPEDPGPSLGPAALDPQDGRPVALGGVIRSAPEDFLVEEIPLFRPLGRGPHTILQAEKQGMSTFDLLLRVSKGAKVSEHVIGYAGLKDARALTRQYLAVPRLDPARLVRLREPRYRVLSAARHVSTLRIGHQRGNRFTIRIREVRPERVPAARRVLEALLRRGMPNAYGSQRFGTRRDGHRLGQAIVNEDWPAFLRHLLGSPSPLEHNPRVREARAAYDEGDVERALRLFPLKHRLEKKACASLLRTGAPREAFLALGRRPRRIWIAAWQSYLFNRVLDRRVRDGTYDRLLCGDVACLASSGACFPVRAVEEEDPEASPTGPLLGHDLWMAEGRPGALEREVLREEGADPEAMRAEHVRARGQRRALRAAVREASLEVEDERTVVVRFVLPPGSYATVLLDLLMRGSADGAPGTVRPHG